MAVGCNTCKTRHARCDEKKPICSNCERLNLQCVQSNFIAPSEYSITTLESTPLPERNSAEPLPPAFSSAPPAIDAPASTWDIFKPRISGLDQVPSESPPTDMLTYINLMTPDDTSDRSSTVPSVTLTSETAFLLQTYLRTVATWMDLMDHTCTYQLSIPRFALSSPLLFHGICAFTAKHLALANNCTNRYWDPVAQAHYGSALRLLIHALNSHDHSHALTATILLSSYEIVAALGSEHHRRHFLGLTMLIKHHGITARSTGIDGANFWVYVRHEIAIALGNGQSLVLNPEDWNVCWEEGERREDVLGNRVLWILARVINLVYGAEGQTEAGRVERQRFLNELEEWRASLSDTFVGVPYGDADEDGFRKVYFGVTAAAAAAFWYHVVHILLYTEPTLQDPSYKPLIQDQAMRITNIAISNFPDSVKVFGTHGLFFAAKHINGLTRKARIWNIITDVEARLGYHTRNMVKKLQDLVEAGL